MFVCLINSCGFNHRVSGICYPRYSLASGERRPTRENGGGGGGLPGSAMYDNIFIALNYVGPKVNIWERTELFSCLERVWLALIKNNGGCTYTAADPEFFQGEKGGGGAAWVRTSDLEIKGAIWIIVFLYCCFVRAVVNFS